MEPKGIDLDEILARAGYVQDYLEKLLSLLQSVHFCHTFIPKLLLGGPDGCGKRLVIREVANKLNMKFCEKDVVDLIDDSIFKTEENIKACISEFASSAPCIASLHGMELFLYLESRDIDRVEQCIRESLDDQADSLSKPIAFISTTHEFDKVDRSLLSRLFHHSIEFTSPNINQATEIVDALLEESKIGVEDAAKLIGKHCNEGEYYLEALVHACAMEELNIVYPQDDGNDDVEPAQENGTRWLDIGGLGAIKREIIDTVQLSLEYPQLRKSGLRRTGILLYGPPGTGKTLLARAVATECSLSFLTVNGPELLDQYVGQSEENIRKVFKRARDCSPSVIFFDEFDSLAPSRGQAGDSGGVMDRIVAQILAEMDGVGKDNGESVFVIAATNRLDLIDSSFLRPGRFDKVLEVPLPNSKESRCQILKAITRKMQLADDVDLAKLESICPQNMSGADFQGLISRAQHKAIQRSIEQVESGLITENDAVIIANMEDLVSSLETE